MCSPMPDLPEHCRMPLDANGDGPAEPGETVAVVCWCGRPGCTEYLVDESEG